MEQSALGYWPEFREKELWESLTGTRCAVSDAGSTFLTMPEVFEFVKELAGAE